MAALKDMAGIYPQLDTQNARRLNMVPYTSPQCRLSPTCEAPDAMSAMTTDAVFYDGLAAITGKFSRTTLMN